MTEAHVMTFVGLSGVLFNHLPIFHLYTFYIISHAVNYYIEMSDAPILAWKVCGLQLFLLYLLRRLL